MESFVIDEEDYLSHYGILRRSGRYPWGSGETQEEIYDLFLNTVNEHKKSGMTDTQIAKFHQISTTELRAAKSIAVNAQRAAKISQAQRLKDKGMGNVEIGKMMGLNESSVRSLLAPGAKERTDIIQTVANVLRDEVEAKKYIDVGRGVENHLGVSSTRLKTAVAALKEEGYNVYYFQTPQVFGVDQKTRLKVLAKKDVSYSEAYQNRGNLQQITMSSPDYGRTFTGNPLPPISINPKRIQVVYGGEGGEKLDGVMFIRPGVKDVSIGEAKYAQVRVLVGKNHYLKGMAIYKDDLPDGVDIQFNTNKKRTPNKTDAMKTVTGDPENPFGAYVSKQITTINKNGKEVPTSAMNILREEGEWFKWSKSLSTQVLSKQSPSLAKAQLDTTYEDKFKEFESIMSLTNPTVRRKLLESFASDVDSSAVHLKAAALPRQMTSVILPIASMPDNQVYAPNFKNGEVVALIRYPHGGKFEIPLLKVNNNHKEAKKILGNARDAIGINKKVADRLSGADFDGDTVLVIPNNSKKIKSDPPLKGLENFDPLTAYPAYPGMKKMSKQRTQTEMGMISNLITDMTIKGANEEELARAVRHSMVVIDAERHGLNYKLSEQLNGISSLKKKYLENGSGASTLISRAKSREDIPKSKPRPASLGGPIDKETGEIINIPTNESYVNKQGKIVIKQKTTTKLAATKDAYTLSSGTKIESVYADHSNKLKALANTARKELVNTPRAKYSPSAKKVYFKEVESLNSKLVIAKRNAPLERQANIIAQTVINEKIASNPDIDKSQIKKIKSIALNDARNRTGAKKEKVYITDSEWKAIQAGAISDSKLVEILANSDLDRVRELATPKKDKVMSPLKVNRAKIMLDSGYTRSDVAKALGVSLTTLDTYTN